ncbi:pyruvate synthase [Anoxybacter fermentans]|uniref:Pyruvate synthase n=1 Tax=Anoxybacter fermentans TaxID=1323375 RepID=A0A3S9T1H0_9FIRM|nr:2-oxoacid:acceptor oxidoreductase family protein [Anoxybacter fermentans]AZR74404.1 pyruvate synthase [Anoxybacter fermentans]
MAQMLEIRWHGRGGQGSKTASILLGKVCSEAGKYIQAFPEYGPERMGAPVIAYNRISDERITVHCQIETPDLVVVLDSTLIGAIDVVEGLKEDGKIIINTDLEPEKMKEKIGFNGELYTIDANKISEEELGRAFPNTPLLGAVVKVTSLFTEDEFVKLIRKEFEKKFAHKPEVIDGNINCIRRAFQEVKSE